MSGASWLASLGIGQIVAFGIVVITILFVLGYLSKKGLFSFKGKGFSIGQDTERLILRQQRQYVDAAVDEALTEIEKKESWNVWKAKYTAERVKNVLENAISFNHITTDRSYVLVKQLEVWSQIQKSEMIDPYYSSDEFKQLVYRWVEDGIKDLYDIRKYYEAKL